jgi:anti-sigma B factor antagonist
MQFITELKLPVNFFSDHLEDDKCIIFLSLQNRFDIYSSTELFAFVKILIKGGIIKIMLNLQDLDYIDSSGIGTLIKITKALRAAKGDLVLINVSDDIKKVFSLVKLERMINMFSTEFDAIGFLRLK